MKYGRQTYSEEDSIACPVCGEVRGDLWDYDWGNRGEIEVECPGCDADLYLTAEYSVTYTATEKLRGGE